MQELASAVFFSGLAGLLLPLLLLLAGPATLAILRGAGAGFGVLLANFDFIILSTRVWTSFHNFSVLEIMEVQNE